MPDPGAASWLWLSHRCSLQDPWEQSVVDGPEYEVECITGHEFSKGVKFYHVTWKEGDCTKEPQENLVGATQLVKDYNEARNEADRQDKARLLEARKLRKAEQLAAATEAKAAACAKALADAMKDAPGSTNSGSNSADRDPTPHDVVAQNKTGRMVLRMHKNKTATVWRAYDLLQEKPSCTIEVSEAVACGCVPSITGGTSNYWQHLFHHHRSVWLSYKQEDGDLTVVGQQELQHVTEAMAKRMQASQQASQKPALDVKAKATLDRLCSEWIVDEDQYLNAATKPGFTRLLDAATDRGWSGACEKTVAGYVSAMANEGKAKTTRLHDIVLEAGLRIVISADLWSKNGVAILGILSHAIVEIKSTSGLMWHMVELLTGAVPCKKDRHTGQYVETATFAQLAELGINSPVEQIFKAKTDRGSNMIKGYESLSHDPCADHLIDSAVKFFYSHEAVAETLKCGRAVVGSFNSSTIGKSDLHQCQATVGLPMKNLVQDVVTRWASTFAMSNSMRENQDAILVYEVKYADVASETFKANKYTAEGWVINNQTAAVLGGLAAASNVLEGKTYATINMVLPYVYGCIATLAPTCDTIQVWDGKPLKAADLHPAVRDARQALYETMMGHWVTHIDLRRLTFLYICTLLDPRLLKLQLPLLSDECKETAFAAFVTEYEMNWAPRDDDSPDKSCSCDHSVGESSRQDASSEDAPFKTVNMGSFVDYLQSLQTIGVIPDANKRTNEPVVLNEAEQYLAMQPASHDIDVLQWWAEHKSAFPHLSRMARQFLSVPATSASAERVFSLAGRIFSDLTQNQNDTTLEDRMWAKVNRKSIIE